MATLATYHEAVRTGAESLSVDRIRAFEASLQPVYAPLTTEDLGSDPDAGEPLPLCQGEIEAVEAFKLVRAFQRTALIYLYRVICGLPTCHALVQQHVEPCLDGLFEVHPSSHIYHCVIFPLYVAGAHAQTSKRRAGVSDMVSGIFNDMRFGSVRAIGEALRDVWRRDAERMSWADMFGFLSPYAVVL
ncbi:hypothetical protein BN1723_016967, partial [Verticillium longisporum]